MSIKNFFYLTFILPLTIFSSESFAKEVIRVKSDPWCPFACDASSTQKAGFVIDVAKAIFSKKGIEVEYKNINYARAIVEARSGQIEAVAGCAKEDAPDFIFPSKPLTATTYQYFSLKDSSYRYKDPASLKGKKIGVINSYTYDVETTEEIQKKNPSFMTISGDDAFSQLIKMIQAKRIDATVESNEVFWDYLNENKIDPSLFKSVGMPKQIPQDISLCFSPKNPKSKVYAEMLVKGLEELKKSGELKKIYEKYKMKYKK